MTFLLVFLIFNNFTSPQFISVGVQYVKLMTLSVKHKHCIRCSMSLSDITWLSDRICTSSEKFKRHATPAFGSVTRICSVLASQYLLHLAEILQAFQ